MNPLPIDELWGQLRDIAHRREVLLGSPQDWVDAYASWRVLDPEQKMLVIQDVTERPADYSSMCGLPSTYFWKKRWERPKAKPRVTRQDSVRAEAAIRLAKFTGEI